MNSWIYKTDCFLNYLNTIIKASCGLGFGEGRQGEEDGSGLAFQAVWWDLAKLGCFAIRVQVLTLSRSLAASLLWLSLRGLVRWASFRSKEALSKHQLRQLILMMAIMTLIFLLSHESTECYRWKGICGRGGVGGQRGGLRRKLRPWEAKWIVWQ